MMEDVKITLSALWVALMLTYLLGDVLRIFSGDFIAGKIGGMQISQKMYLGFAILMVIPPVNVSIPAIEIWRFENGRIKEIWMARDILTFLTQAGVIPAME